MNEIRWEGPPPSRSGEHTRSNDKWLRDFRAELIANQGTWAVYRERPSDNDVSLRNTVTHIRRGRAGWGGYQWEAVSRRVNGTTTLYVRCLGPVDGAS